MATFYADHTGNVTSFECIFNAGCRIAEFEMFRMLSNEAFRYVDLLERISNDPLTKLVSSALFETKTLAYRGIFEMVLTGIAIDIYAPKLTTDQSFSHSQEIGVSKESLLGICFAVIQPVM